jgi:hypothetical protein
MALGHGQRLRVGGQRQVELPAPEVDAAGQVVQAAEEEDGIVQRTRQGRGEIPTVFLRQTLSDQLDDRRACLHGSSHGREVRHQAPQPWRFGAQGHSLPSIVAQGPGFPRSANTGELETAAACPGGQAHGGRHHEGRCDGAKYFKTWR